MEIIVDGHRFSDSQSDIVIGFTEAEIKELAANPVKQVKVYKSVGLNPNVYMGVDNARLQEDINELKEIMGLKHPD